MYTWLYFDVNHKIPTKCIKDSDLTGVNISINLVDVNSFAWHCKMISSRFFEALRLIPVFPPVTEGVTSLLCYDLFSLFPICCKTPRRLLKYHK